MKKKIAKDPVIRLIRYTRLSTEDSIDVISNLYAITWAIELDYEKREIRYSYSVCNGDNFNKELGIELAIRRFKNGYITIPMPENGIPEEGVMSLISVNVLQDNSPERHTLRNLLRRSKMDDVFKAMFKYSHLNLR